MRHLQYLQENGVLLFSCDTCDILRNFVLKKKNTAKYRTKDAVATFFGILKKHVIPAVWYTPRFW